MSKRIISENGVKIALIQSESVLITDGASVLELMADVYYNDNCGCVCLNKEALAERFFVLSSGIAGDVLQKIINYQMKIAIIGDFSIYTSKPLKDFIYECNNGKNIFFVADEEEAIRKLSK